MDSKVTPDKPAVVSGPEKVLNDVYDAGNVADMAGGYNIVVGENRKAFFINSTYMIFVFNNESAERRSAKAISRISGKINEANMYSLIQKCKQNGGRETVQGGVTIYFDGSDFTIKWR